MSKKNVLIIGGLGFIGSHLAKECINNGYAVTILSRSKSKIANISGFADKVELIIKDLRDISSEVEGFDYIFHLAGSKNNYVIIEDQPFNDIELNCTCTIVLLEAIKKYNPSCSLYFASTIKVNGTPDKLPVNTSSPCNPLSLYGATRLAGEHFCQIYKNVFNLKTTIIRFTNIFGVKEAANPKQAGFNYMIAQAVKGHDINLYSNGDFFRDYLYVTDAARACLAIAEKGFAEQIYYVGRGEFIKFRKMAEIVAQQTGVNIKPVEPPDFHKRVGIKDFVCDNEPLKKLGWLPEVSMEEGIKKTIDYYRSLEGLDIGK